MDQSQGWADHRSSGSTFPRVIFPLHFPLPLGPRTALHVLRLRRVTALCLALCFLLLSGCAGLAPSPRYTAPHRRGPLAIVGELESRRRAFRQADPSRLMRVVDTYLGVPYRWGGTTRQGMDCSALTRAVFREAYGLELPRTSGEMFRLGRLVEPGSSLRPGDLVFFRLSESGPGVSHVGVFVGDGRFAHASSSRGGVLDELSASYFKSRFAGARRILP